MKLTLKKAKQMMAENGGSLDLRGTPITSLPENLTVGDSLYLICTQITDEEKERRKVKKLNGGDYVPGRYLYADGILTHIKSTKKSANTHSTSAKSRDRM